MATRRELIAAVGVRYRAAAKAERRKILDEFTGLTGFHRKHAIRVLSKPPRDRREKRARDGLYGEAVHQALIIVWEAADRLCGKRLKALIPTLVPAIERHGHVAFDSQVRKRLMQISAATIDRLLVPVLEQARGHRKRRPGVGSAIRRSVRVRTFSDWNDPPPGFFETDMVEQKNGAIVRRLVGYGRLSGVGAAAALAELYAVARVYVNFFQPSFKLKSKSRDGARVVKKYHEPMTPCERLLQYPAVDEATKGLLREQLQRLDPVQQLQQMRAAQQRLAELVIGDGVRTDPAATRNVDSFLASLAEAWKDGEVRPTHRRKPSAPRTWRTRVDPFEQVWPMIERWLEEEPGASAKALLGRLTEMLPGLYAGTKQLRTLQRRVQAWRREQARELVFRVSGDRGSSDPQIARALGGSSHGLTEQETTNMLR